jgi:hypothetical protein
MNYTLVVEKLLNGSVAEVLQVISNISDVFISGAIPDGVKNHSKIFGFQHRRPVRFESASRLFIRLSSQSYLRLSSQLSRWVAMK